MSKTTKLLALFLCLLMLVASFAACGKSNGTETDGTKPSTADGKTDPESGEPSAEPNSETEEETLPEVETNEWGDEAVENNIPADLKFNGETINFLIRSTLAYNREWTSDKPSSTLDQQIFRRNRDVQNQLDVTFAFTQKSDTSINKYIQQQGMAGGKEIDIISNAQFRAGSLDLLPFYRNLYDKELTYLDLSKPYWSQLANEVLAVNGKQYYMTGDINLTLWDRALVVFFSKSKLADWTDGMKEKDLYQVVIDGNWTYEYFYDIIKDIWVDDEDGTFGNNNDFVGVTSIAHSEACDAFFYGWGVSGTEIDPVTEEHRVVTGNNRQKLLDAWDKLMQLWNCEGAYLHIGGPGVASGNNTNFFTTGHALFDVDTIAHSDADLSLKRDMVGGFGIVPVPKYDEHQTRYYTGVQSEFNVNSIMWNQNDGAMLSAVIELLAYKSYESVRPYYIKSVLKERTLSEGAGAMFDLIMAGVRFDFADFYENGGGNSIRGFLWTNAFTSRFVSHYEDGHQDGQTGAGPYFAEREESLNEKLKEVDEKLLYN